MTTGCRVPDDSGHVPTTPTAVPVTVAHGDGIGPEIMRATLDILSGAGAQLDIEEVQIGEAVYLRGHTSGIDPQAWESLRRTKVFLKAPITTPQGGGFKSLNVTVRKTLGLYANVRPCVAYAPFVPTRHPGMDVVIVRENEEDLYAGIEHRQTDEVTQCLKLISRPGCERICRYAFEYARRHGRSKVTCLTKDNIMKMTDGLFHQVFDEVAADYPEIASEHWIVDIGAAKLSDTPESFDVLVVPNLYGDILSDVAAQIAGSVGMAGSANIGDNVAMFEAIHGSAPRRAGHDVANPSGLLLGAVMMLVHIGQGMWPPGSTTLGSQRSRQGRPPTTSSPPGARRWAPVTSPRRCSRTWATARGSWPQWTTRPCPARRLRQRARRRAPRRRSTVSTCSWTPRKRVPITWPPPCTVRPQTAGCSCR